MRSAKATGAGLDGKQNSGVSRRQLGHYAEVTIMCYNV